MAKKKQHTVYHKDGSVSAKGDMIGAQYDGYWEWFRKDGSRMRSGCFDAGKQIGEWATYDSKGKVARVTSFDKK